MSQPRNIFRKQSLDKLASPDRLDEILRVVRPQSWIVLLGLGGGLALALVWGIVGRIPETASGTAVLVRPKQVVAFQSPANGQIASIEVTVGDVVRRGALLAKLHLPVVETELEQERTKLEHFERRSRELSGLEGELAELELQQILEQRVLIQERSVSVTQAAESYREKSSRYLAEQRDNIATARRLSGELGASLRERLNAFSALNEEGIVPRDPVVAAQGRVVENELSLANLDVREQELKLQENSAQESFDKDMDLVKGLRIQLNELELRSTQIERRLREGELNNEASVEEIKRRIEQLESHLHEEGSLFSQYDGRVLEISAAVGDLLGRGQRVGKMEIDDPSMELMALAYFQIGDGKKIEVGQRIRVSPDSVQKERFGGIVGRVVEVTAYPVTAEAAGNQIGDVMLARDLLGGASRIGVIASLDRDTTPTGFRWTSGAGPDLAITPGTTAEVRVTTDERAPITLVLPFLRTWTGI